MNNTRCRYCKGTEDVLAHTVIGEPLGAGPYKGEMHGTCRGCMNAPACGGCYKHPVGDEVTIITTGAGPLCEECCAGLGLPVPVVKAPEVAPAAPEAAKASRKSPRKPALVGAA